MTSSVPGTDAASNTFSQVLATHVHTDAAERLYQCSQSTNHQGVQLRSGHPASTVEEDSAWATHWARCPQTIQDYYCLINATTFLQDNEACGHSLILQTEVLPAATLASSKDSED